MIANAEVDGNKVWVDLDDGRRVLFDGDIDQLSISGINGSEFIVDGVLLDQDTSFFGGSLAFAQEVGGTFNVTSSINQNGATSIEIESQGNPILRLLSNGAQALFDGAGKLWNGVIDIVGGARVSVEEGQIAVFEKEDEAGGFFHNLFSKAKEIISLGANAILTLAQKTTLATFRLISGILNPFAQAIDHVYGLAMGRDDNDFLEGKNLANATKNQFLGMSKEQVDQSFADQKNPDFIELLGDPENNLVGGKIIKGSALAGDYRHLLPQSVQDQLLTNSDLRVYVATQDYFFIGDTTGVSDYYNTQFQNANFMKRLLLAAGLHNEIKSEWLGQSHLNLGPNFPLLGVPDGLAQFRSGNAHITDIFRDATNGFFAMHHDPNANTNFDGFLAHILTDVPAHLLGLEHS